MLRWLSNVVSGRIRHWNDTNNSVVTVLWQRCGGLSAEGQAVYKEIIASSASLADRLLGPDRGSNRLLSVDPKAVSKSEFARLHNIQVAAMAGMFAAINPFLRDSLQAALSTLTAHDPEATDIFREYASATPDLKSAGPALWSRLVALTHAPTHSGAMFAYAYTMTLGAVATAAFEAARTALSTLK